MTVSSAARVETVEDLFADYQRIRGLTETLCAPLAVDDYQVQSIAETSPPKWHLAHTTWFFEAFVLSKFGAGYKAFRPEWHYLFNSYYESVGPMHPRPCRGLLSRPTVEAVYEYREYVDAQMAQLLNGLDVERQPALCEHIVLGLQHEQQHQELLLMDIKHNLFANPLFPAYRAEIPRPQAQSADQCGWIEVHGGQVEMGAAGGFRFDNEHPRHRTLVQPHRLADRLVTNREYRAFMEDDGYLRPEFWMADGWMLLREKRWRHPLYWVLQDEQWLEFTLGGLRPLDPDQPVAHVSYYEADAYARWAGARLPVEAELEQRLLGVELDGNLLDSGYLQPVAGSGQWFGDLWEWTASAYAPYPGYRPPEGALGEYNGKFMCNQMVLRGGCCVTSRDHVRATYRNFFYPHDRWPFTGIRLAQDMRN